MFVRLTTPIVKINYYKVTSNILKTLFVPGYPPEKFYTLPRKSKRTHYPTNSLDKASLKRRYVNPDQPPKKPPRTFATVSTQQPSQKPSIFDIFRRTDKKPDAKRPNLHRSVSAASSLRSHTYGPEKADLQPLKTNFRNDIEDQKTSNKSNKKQLSPIIEDTQRNDYFSARHAEDKENILLNDTYSRKLQENNKKNQEQSITEQLKQYIDEVDEQLFKETGIRISPSKETRKPEIVIIDVDKAEKISQKKKKNRLKPSFLGKKLKSITKKATKPKSNDVNKNKKAASKYSKQITPIEELQKAVNVERSSVKRVKEAKVSANSNNIKKFI